ncbi:radical SAM protein [Gimesia sp.]|uniref:radical SAM protein n=1 Tax=Gimesia sp. TaxID=2024833 RepID=UPI000C541700|nr:radical SAM protein [Gimesia sp.]MAX36377.1 radical SAM protein [Gimesia sp.]HAH46506.1 radical SAM protein [Planctomycetaceae bacterium]HBL42434.1 radical SAM protein [Planctomycetaceae bacterium]|tara:strand:+ start:829 stop:1749 length:921 start_codon:yes stop_codon:yes gene_type:complete
MHLPEITDQQILAARPPKNRVSPLQPYAFLNETEYVTVGQTAEISTIFLTNRECPFRCLMCDLWKNTLDESLKPGQIIGQIRYALANLPPARQIKLYNSGNFFDAKAILPEDLSGIAALVINHDRVIVENHPLLCNQTCIDFQQQLTGQLEIALGLETIHPQILTALNKRMSLDDFVRATDFLLEHGIQTRAFILLKPPFLKEQEGIDWAIRSVEYAFSRGVSCCSLIPTRPGNGMLEQLEQSGHYSLPNFSSIETTLESCLQLNRGRVFMDLWELDQLYQNEPELQSRLARLRKMNLTQSIPDHA